MKYQINDPTTPDLLIDVPSTTAEPHFPYHIVGSDMENQVTINCVISFNTALHYLATILPVLKWSSTDSIELWPIAGIDFNAFYNRTAFKFFFKEDPLTKQVVYAANSSKVSIHELNHGALDAYRPDLWNTQCMEIWGFHEGQADIGALNSIMQNDLVLEKALKETNGNLKLSSVISRIGEEIGNAIWHARGHKDDNLNGLRNAINDFTFIPPENLPSSAPDSQLSNECHSYGRLITGTWYDVLVGIYEQELAGGLDQMSAIKKARDYWYPCFVKAVARTPVIVRFHEALAKNVLAVDLENGGNYQTIMSNVFAKRQILQPVIKALAATSKDDMAAQLTNGVSTKTSFGETIVVNETKTLKLSDHITQPAHLQAMFVAGYDLSSCEVEAAAGKYYEFDQNGMLLYEIAPTDYEIINSAQMCVKTIESIGPGADTMWEVTNNKLLRTFICGSKK